MMTQTCNLEKYLSGKASYIEKRLARRILSVPDTPAALLDAMNYSLSAGGKRLRPALVLAAAEAFGLKASDAEPAACAIEMVHTYSLIHDDLPALDNDTLRRGKPTSHTVFGEATAILAGDALLTLAFETCAACAGKSSVGPARTLKALALLARAAGASGMVGGQSSDIFAEGLLNGDTRRSCAVKTGVKKGISYFTLPPGRKTPGKADILRYIHLHKTGALLRCAVEMGATLGGAGAGDLARMRAYGDSAGLAFQITDDILDVTADKKKLGKLGSDAANGKLTYVTLYGLDAARSHARRQTSKAAAALNGIRGADRRKLAPLYALAEFMLGRTH
ncbi:MAG: polyprenyl synthetase family protein [Elusimicrobiaceae bacterium]|nr:polyprenyl synthetase family protein [Elusimicrobiaceae bacterium]